MAQDGDICGDRIENHLSDLPVYRGFIKGHKGEFLLKKEILD